MNKRKVTKHKGSKVKANNDPSEVFVLPPNLLEALGINLGNIETAPECTSSNQVSEKGLISNEKSAGQGTPSNLSENNCTASSENDLPVRKTAVKDLFSKEKAAGQGAPANIPENNYTKSSEKESSIIQTANLMTASVFLSPTFISNNRSIIEGEVEILGNAESVDEAISKPNACSKNNEYDQSDCMIQGVTFPNQHQEAVSGIENPIDAQSSEVIQETNKDVQATDVHVDINNFAKDINFDDHADEAYSSDASNGNVEMNDKSDGLNSSVLLSTNNNKKISIISQQILDPSQFKSFEGNYSAKKHSLVPVAMNTVLKNSYRNSINSDCDPNLVTYYVAPSVIDLHDVNEQYSECEKITDSFLKNRSLNENDDRNRNYATCDSLDNYLNPNILSNVSEDIVIGAQMQESSSQHLFNVHKSEFDSHLVLPDILNLEEKSNIMKNNISDTKNTNAIATNYEEEKVNETFQTVHPKALDIQNVYGNRNLLSTVSQGVAIRTQMQEDLSQHALEVHESNIQLIVADTFEREDNDYKMEMNISDTKITNTVTKNFEEEKVNETLLKGNPKALDKQNFYNNLNMMSSVNEIVASVNEEGSPQHAFEVHKREFDTQIALPDVISHEDSGNTMETSIVDTKKSKTIATNYEEQKLNETLQKVDPNALDEQNFYVYCNTLSNVNEDVTIGEENLEGSYIHPFEVYKGELDTQLVLPDTLNREDRDNIMETNISDTQKSDIIEINYKKQKINETLQKIDPNALDDKHHELSTKAAPDNVNTKLTNINKNYRKTSHDVLNHPKKRRKDFFAKDSKINRIRNDELSQNRNSNQSRSEINVYKHKLNDTVVKRKQVMKNPKRPRHKNTNLKIKEMLVDVKAKPTQNNPEELNKCSVPDNSTKSLSTSKADPLVQLGCLGNKNNVQEDKIREIAGYLSQFAELQRRKKIFKDKQNISSIKTFTNKKHATNTKISIQGVEKPGGSEKFRDHKNDKNMKTYERKRKNKPPVKVLMNKPNFDTLIQKINLSVNSSYNTCNDADLCLCDDFGRLIYDDNESMYEHIHFWNKKQVDCTPELIFSIYNENVPAEINNDDDTKNLQDHSYIPIENPSIPDRKICWNEINFIDSQVSDEERSEHIVIRESSVGEQMKPDAFKCSISRAKSTEFLHKNAMVGENQLKNCQETVNNNTESDINQKKRKFSSTFNENDKSPAKQHVTDSRLPSHVKSDKIVKKRKCSEKEHTGKIIPGVQPDSEESFAKLSKDTSAICGVCQQNVKDADWVEHIATQHNFLAWRVNEQPLDLKNRQHLIQHLSTLIKQYGVLSCNKCGTSRKYAKPFLQHINQCTTDEEFQSESALTSSSDSSKANPVNHGISSIQHVSVKKEPEPVRLVECGVCGESVQDKDWNNHIGSQHNYLAWKHGEQTLNVDDEDQVKEYLYNITKEHGGLTCAKCGITRKYVKSYQSHIKICDGQSVSDSVNESSPKGSLHIVSLVKLVTYESDPMNNDSIENGAELLTDELIKCGVCGEFMQSKDWNSHIESQHNYLAWKHGETTLDVEDEVAVKEHLYKIMKECGGLKCVKCGLIRKYVKSYLTHIKNCDGLSESLSGCAINSSLDISEIEPAQHVSDLISNISIENEVDAAPDVIQCAVCGESMHHNEWYDHIGLQHNYLAWRCGDPIVDFDDEEATHNHLYAIMKEYEGLKCVKCGLNRKYVKSYLNHVKNCTGHSNSQIESTINESLNISEVEPAKMIRDSISHPSSENDINGILIKCGVCEQIVQNNNWYSHIQSEHNYLAWKYGEPALDVDKEEAVREHLNNITKQFGRLNCTKCGLTRKYVRSYLTHVKSCSGLSKEDIKPIPDDSTPNIVVLSEAEQHTGLTKCGVCGQYMPLTDWTAHIESKHNYLAWKDGEPPLDINDTAKVLQHLKNIIIEIGMLVCTKCGAQRKFAKRYLQHIEKCDGPEETANSSTETDGVIWPSTGTDQVKCGVCDELVQASLWIKHIAEQHHYLAKKVGESPLDVGDEEEVYRHLYNIALEHGGLTCQKCGKERKYVKSYLEHVRKCGQDLSVTGDTTFEASTTLDTSESLVDFYSGGTCGVCEKEVETGKWIQHIQKEHNYLAWRKGEKPWNLDDFTEVNEYLYDITKKMNGLTCNKCGLVRKYVKSYLTHIKSCTVVDFNLATTLPDGVGPVSDNAYRCAMCQKEIDPSDWKNHAMKEHYNITWIIGETPIDIKNPYAVEKYLKEYKQYNSLKCNSCGATRASFAGFYAHIITCGKTEEEIEMFQSVCDICNNKYLCIYKNQHMMIHRVQSYNKELKMSKESQEKKEESVALGKRRAAQKAQSVIETYSSDMSQLSHKCSTCGFGTDFKEELQSHRCDQNEKDFSEDESSAAPGEGSEDDSADSEVDSDVSRQEEEDQQQTQKRIRLKEPVSGGSKLSKIYFKVDNPDAFIKQSDIDFCNAFFTDDTLFSKWLSCERETVSENDLPRYLPPMKQSCKVQAGFDWTTLNRFEAKSGDGTSIFVGACIVCIAWIPLRVEDIRGDSQNLLAIACHNDADCPRYECDETPQHENLIQIWDFGACRELPRIVYGIAHDFGTVWSMDWCPSGARHALPEDLTDGQPYRLGLLAVACSNGSAYIFSVPHPCTVVKNDHFVQKLKPVAELRMKMENITQSSERKVYQATSITWSKQKGHEIILVGYADGSTGYYDINNESPLSRKMEDGVEIFYPYDEGRPHNTCITATDMYPRLGGGFVSCSASSTGAEMALPGAVRVRSQLPARAALFAPHWPTTLLAGDAAIMTAAANELEWSGPARKLGGVRALAGCARCGRVAGAAPPALRLMCPHPAYPEFRKPIIGMIEMIPLTKKIKKQVNDQLAMKIEPLTYSETISKYGIQFRSVRKRDKVAQQQCASKPKVHCPERFPLADVESMAFCPAKRHHDMLAVATHSGIVFFTKVNL